MPAEYLIPYTDNDTVEFIGLPLGESLMIISCSALESYKKKIIAGLLMATQCIYTYQQRTIIGDEFEQLLMNTACGSTLWPFIEEVSHNATNQTLQISKSPVAHVKKKPWTFIVYIAADNNLRTFAAYNLKQMAAIGSNDQINIVAHLDICLNTKQKTTRRYFIEKNKIVHVNPEDPNTQRMDSGNPQTLISCCKWAIENYPAQDYALILWNHGTGILDPAHYGKAINTSELFTFNPNINKLELDRSVPFLELFDKDNQDYRGICWDDSSGNFLTNQKLEFALNEVCNGLLKGKKLTILGFDACLMAMLEIATLTKKYAHIMVGSQEVELGTGWDYTKVLTPFAQGKVDPITFAKNIVSSYQATYQAVTNDYTQSAMDLGKIPLLEQNIDAVGQLLIACMKKQKLNSVKNALRTSRNKFCTHFDEPSYIDLHNFYTNIKNNLNLFALTDTDEQKILIDALSKKIDEGLSLINEVAFAYTSGSNLKNARGISIYFPDHRMHNSYPQTIFATTNSWAVLVAQYIFS